MSSHPYQTWAFSHGGGRDPKQVVEAYKAFYSLGSELSQCHCCCIPLLERNYKSSLDLWDGEIEFKF
jgi:hypothetical protein